MDVTGSLHSRVIAGVTRTLRPQGTRHTDIQRAMKQADTLPPARPRDKQIAGQARNDAEGNPQRCGQTHPHIQTCSHKADYGAILRLIARATPCGRLGRDLSIHGNILRLALPSDSGTTASIR